MSHPWVHAVSSARKHGGQSDDYFDFHSLVDLSKSGTALITHRAVFHSHEGIDLLVHLVGQTTANADTKTLATQHCEEDLGRVPYLAEYWEGVEPPFRFRGLLQPSSHADLTHKRFGGDWRDHYTVHRVMDFHSHAACTTYGVLLHHALGPWLVEKKFGPVIQSAGVTLYTRYLCEQHILADLGRIPSLSDWLDPIAPKPWMAGAGKLKNLIAR